MTILYQYPPKPVTVPPTQFILDGVVVDVTKDTVTPSNSVPLPVEAASLPLPSGAATEAKQDTGNSSLSSIDGKFTTLNAKDFATSAKQDTGNSSLSSIDGKLTTLNAKDFATSAKQDTGNSSLSNIDGKLTTLNAKDFATSAKQDTGNTSLSSIDGKLQVNGVISSGNTSATPLGISGNFTGSWEELVKYDSVTVGIYSDVASATDGFKFEYSYDGITVHHTHTYNYLATDGVDYNFTAGFRYFRVNYTNGAVAQASFKIISVLKSSALFPSSYRLSYTVDDESAALITKSVIVGKTTAGGGTYVGVKVNPSGALTADVTGTVAVSSIAAGTNNIGKVDVNSLPLSFNAGNADATTQRVVVASNQGNLPVLVKSSLLNVAYDQLVLTYVGATTNIATVTAKLSGSTVATLTLTYDGSNRLTDVTRT